MTGSCVDGSEPKDSVKFDDLFLTICNVGFRIRAVLHGVPYLLR